MTADPTAIVGTCECFSEIGAAGENCADCAPGFTRSGDGCISNSAPTCFDGVQNGEETGIDCGGDDCNSCVESVELDVVPVVVGPIAAVLFLLIALVVWRMTHKKKGDEVAPHPDGTF
jgi:hypothetical protein